MIADSTLDHLDSSLMDAPKSTNVLISVLDPAVHDTSNTTSLAVMHQQRSLLLFLLSGIFVLVHGAVEVSVTPQGDLEVLSHSVVSISYEELVATAQQKDNQGISALIESAFGPRGLGFLEVSNIPQEFQALRTQVLTLSHALAHLSTEELTTLERPDLHYSIGWSHGKEQFKNQDSTQLQNNSDATPIYDTSKGSFYLDPYRPEQNVFPSSFSMEQPLLEMTRWMTETSLKVARLCDQYVSTKTSDSADDITSTATMIEDSLRSSNNPKARLLYYFPVNETSEDSSSDAPWCGWHKDHGSLTVLLPALFVNETIPSQPQFSNQPPPSPTPSGLIIQTRDGFRIPVSLPPTSVGIQLGETVEIMSGGRLQATPHAVAASRQPNLGRTTLAVFVQPEKEQTLPPCPRTSEDDTMFSLCDRHRSTFGAFQQATFDAFS
eukprot:Nitzschia sp. Nitz4//scaffold98_size77359//14847//16154//NITZ4_005539-RA/size77359-processed-gene-0.33-mRNA-1//-1//CDS//3329560730//7892//frame0